MHGAMRCPTPLWPHPSPLFRPCEGRGPEAVLPVVSLQHLVRRGPSRFGQLGSELLEVQPVAREDEADEVVAGRRLDRAKSTDRKTTISPRTASGAALSRASNASHLHGKGQSTGLDRPDPVNMRKSCRLLMKTGEIMVEVLCREYKNFFACGGL